MHLACVILHMSMPEALVAATINAAASLGRADKQGSLEERKQADMLILDSPRFVSGVVIQYLKQHYDHVYKILH